MTQAMATTLLSIPIDQLEENPVALREVDKDGDEYKRLRDSVELYGVINAISCTPAFLADGRTPKQTADGRPIYRIVDGLHRWTASKEVGLDAINATVLSADDLKVAKLQFIGNAGRVKTKPFEFANHLNRVLSADPTTTLNELATEVAQSASWIGKLLGLVNLHPEIGKLVDQGKISVSNAADLAKLRPQEEQQKFVQDAMELKPEQFGPKVKARIKELRDAKRAARDPNAEPSFVAVGHFRKKPEIEAELSAGAPTIAALVKAKGITSIEEAIRETLKFVLHLDEASVAEARAKHEQRENERKAEAAKRSADRAEQRAKETREAASRIEAATK